MVQQVISFLEQFPQWRVENSSLFKHIVNKYSGLDNESEKWHLALPKNKQFDSIRKFHDITNFGHLVGIGK